MSKSCMNCTYRLMDGLAYPCTSCYEYSNWCSNGEEDTSEELILKTDVYNAIMPLIKDYCSEQVVNDIRELINDIKGYKKVV